MQSIPIAYVELYAMNGIVPTRDIDKESAVCQSILVCLSTTAMTSFFQPSFFSCNRDMAICMDDMNIFKKMVLNMWGVANGGILHT